MIHASRYVYVVLILYALLFIKNFNYEYVKNLITFNSIIFLLGHCETLVDTISDKSREIC